MSLLYSTPSFKYPDAELRKNQDFMDFNHYYQEHQQNTGLARYRSAPSSFFENLVTGTNDHGGGGGGGDGRIGCEDYRYLRSSSPEIDTMLAKFMAPCNVSGDSNSHELQEFGERPVIKQEVVDSQMVYQNFSGHDLANDNSVSVGNSMDGTFGVINSMSMENSTQARKMSPPNGSNVVRQNSSPAGLFSNLIVDSGFSGFGVCNGTNGEAGPSTSRLSNHVNFSPASKVLPQIAEFGDEDMGTSSADNGVRKRQYMTSFTNDAWDDISFNDFKRLRDNDGNVFAGLNTMDDQNENLGSRVTGLTHHLSLPKTAAEMATIEKYLQFQGTVPCKIRAKRGCATHPRSIAERVRRKRISERMKRLQDLFPNMDKQTNTAEMLELAVEYIKDLQNQIKTLSDTKAKCICLSKQR